MLIEPSSNHLTATPAVGLLSATPAAYAPPASYEPETRDDGWRMADEELLRCGYPCAVAFGLQVSEVPDPAVDVHVLAMRNIERDGLRRELRALPAVDRLVMHLLCGIGCSRHRLREVGELMGLTDDDVMRAGRRALAALSARGVDVTA